MTVNETAEYLQRTFSKLDGRVIHDVDRHGEEFCEIIFSNNKLPSAPIAVIVADKGCSVSVGQFECVTGSDRMSAGETVSAINDIISDRIIFVMAYRSDDDIGFGKPFFTRIFALTDGEDDMSAEYERFISTISSPLSKLSRFFTSLKGRFIVFSFSGNIYRTITR